MLVPSGVRGPGSFLIVYLWEYKHGNGWGVGTPLSYHQANVCVLYTVLLHQLRTRYTHRVTVMCGSRLFRSIETNSNERPHKFHFSLQIGFFKCCYCCVPYFLRLIMCKRKGVFFFLPFLCRPLLREI